MWAIAQPGCANLEGVRAASLRAMQPPQEGVRVTNPRAYPWDVKNRTGGFSVIEMILVMAILGILAGIGYVLLPRQTMAVNQGERILGSAIQFTRFEAIKRNATLEAVFEAGATVVVVRDPSDGAVIRTFPLDPQGSRVSVKNASPGGTIAFNARGVATTQITRSITIGIVGSATHDLDLTISGQGTVRRAS